MPAHKPVRPAPGTATVLPSPEDEIVQRCLDRLELVIGQLQARLSGLSTIDGVVQFAANIRGTGSAAMPPTTNGSRFGEIVLNADPVAGGFIGWVWVSPGTWKSFGAITP